MWSLQRTLREKEKGMVTVEAALIVPFLFFIILAIMYLAFYYMDEAKVWASTDVVLSFAAQSVGRNQSLLQTNYEQEEKKIAKQLRQELKGRLLLLSLKKTEVTVNSNEIRLQVSLTGKTAIWRYFGLEKVLVKGCCTTEIGNYGNWMRRVQAYSDRKGEEEDAN